MMPLCFAGTGQTVTIRKITGKDEVRRHLAGLGFLEGGQVTVLSEAAGGLILNVRGCRVALDRSMANRIMI